jgi:hypothetical protein
MVYLLLAASNLFAQMFGGSWTCHMGQSTTTWVIESAPGDKWATVRWGAQDAAGQGGIAYVGFVPAQNDWAFQDFHYDGTFGVTTSVGPDKENVWTWAGGGYYTPQGVLHGVITWKLASPDRIERTFAAIVDGKAQSPSSDYCTRNTSK